MPIDPKTSNATESGDKKPAEKLTTAEMSVLGLGLMALVSGLLLGWDLVWAMLFAALVTAAVSAGARDPSNLEASNVAGGGAKTEPEQNAAIRQRKLEGLVTTGETRFPAHDIGDPQHVASNAPSLVHANGYDPRPPRRAGRGSR